MQQQKNLRDNLQSLRSLHPESPQVFKERQGTHNEFNQISPIPTLSAVSSDFHSQNTNEKPYNDRQGGKQKSHQNYYQGTSNPSNNYMDIDTPNTLVKEFYRQGQTKFIGSNNIENDDEEIENNNFYFDGENQAYSSNRQDYSSGIYSQAVQSQHAQSTGIKQMGKQLQRDFKQAACTDFDLTAKEISSNKRPEKGKNTIISGRTSHSPIDGPPSNSETVKWAFSNKDSQETQKKISIINRESINAQDLISRSLKSHDSKGQLSQQTNSTHNMPLLKGKALDFANMEPSKQQIESALFYSNSNKHHNINLVSSQTFESNMITQNEEGKMISFLEDETELLLSSQKKALRNTKPILKYSKNQKCLTKHKFEVKEPLQALVDNSIDCQLCNKQKIYDSSLNCSRIDEPKSHSEIIKQNLEKKYLTSREYYNVKIINDIIYNEQTHIVSVFKDYLIYDDISEFLKRFYYRQESIQRLPRMFEFYEKYSKVFANYVILPENKYLFKNIEKKQRLIDEKQRIIQEQQEKALQQQNGLNTSGDGARKNNRHKDRFSSQQQNSSNISEFSTNRMFDTRFINSVANIQASGFIEPSSMQSSRINNSRYQDHLQNCSILVQQQLQLNMENAAAKKKKKRIEELDFDELISKFIAKDSQSQIQQSSIMTTEQNQIDQQEALKESKRTPVQFSHKSENMMITSTQPTQKKPQVYEYQEKKVLQPSSIIQSDNSKTLSDNNLSQGRPTSSKPNQEQNKRLSSGSQKQSGQNTKTQSKNENPNQKPSEQSSKDGKILNYNIYNNFNQFINNENYYIGNNNQGDNQIIATQEENQASTPNNQFIVQSIQGSQTARGSSLQRNQSRSNLHQMAQQQQLSTKSNVPLITDINSCQTPLRGNPLSQERKTPGSGRLNNLDNNVKVLNQMTQNDEVKLFQKLQKDDGSKGPQIITINNRSSSQASKLTQDRAASPTDMYSQRTTVFAATLNTCRPSTELGQRDLSKDKKQMMPQQKQLQSAQVLSQQFGSNQGVNHGNQMFKNDMIASLQNKMSENPTQYNSQTKIQTQEYNSANATAYNSNSNVRSVERLKSIEEEIEKDYSKYVNEYGLTKTAFAKAVNALREKSQTQQPAQNLQAKTPQLQSQPSTTRQARLGQNSNEKKRSGSNNPRSGSTSQTRKVSQNRQKQNGQDSTNEYMNTNRGDSQKQIRSVRTKINSQNSSCYQRSSKLSPDKNFISGTSQFLSNQNILGLTQTMNGQLSNATSNYITLKAQPTKQAKGIKIKFPLNSQRGASTNKQANTSQNQTPKRMKLQKTKSTSNIPGSVTSRGQSGMISTSRGRIIGGPEVMIYDEMSQQMNGTNPTLQFLQQNNIRGSNNTQDLLNSQNLNDNHYLQQALLQQQQTFTSSSCGTYTTTSILNSPLSYKNQASSNAAYLTGKHQPVQQVKSSSKGRQSSRNGSNSQHQSQKSIGGHQRVTSNSNILQTSCNKIKSKGDLTIGAAEYKRMSAGSNLSKKSINAIHHQPTTSNMQQQILQLLMSYQSQHEGDVTGVSNNQQIGVPLSYTLKKLQANSNTSSMKDLKSLNKNTGSMINDLQIIKASKNLNLQGNNMVQQPSMLNTQRQNGPSNILMINQNSRKSTSKSGKNTARDGGSKKRIQQNVVMPYQLAEYPSTLSQTNQFLQNTTNNHELSSRIQAAISNNYGDQMNLTNATSNGMNEPKSILSYSKSQENFDLIKLAAQRALENQHNLQQQDLRHMQSNPSILISQQQSAQNKASFNFLQNLKAQQENHPQISLSKIKLMPPSAAAYQLQQPLQSARNIQFESNLGGAQNFKSNHSNNENSNSNCEAPQMISTSRTNGPTNIIIGQNFEKPSSRRTSGKFNPSSTKSTQHQ